MAQTVQLGNLAVNITGSSAEFVRSVKAARKQTAQWKRDVRNMRRSLRSLQQNVSGTIRTIRNFGFAVVGLGASFVAITKKASDWGAELLENSRLVGVSVEQYQGLRRLFASDGLGFSQAQRAIVRFNDVLNDALLGKGEGLEVFEQLGLDPTTINGVYDGILKVADALQKVTDQDTRLAIGSGLFGTRGARAILPLQGGREQVEGQIGYFNRLLTTLNENQLQQLKDLAQAFTDLGDQIGATTAEVIAEYADELRAQIERATRGFPEFLDKVQLTFQVIRETIEPILKSLAGIGATYGIIKGAKFLQTVFQFFGTVVHLMRQSGGGGILTGLRASMAAAPPGTIGAVGVGLAAGAYTLKNVWDAFFGVRDSFNRDRATGRENIVSQFREQMGRIEDRELLESIRTGLRAAIAGSLDEALATLTPLGYGSLAIQTPSNLRFKLDELNDRIARLGDVSQETASKAVLLTRVLRSEFDLQAVAPGLGRQFGHATVLRNIPGQEGISDFYGLEAVSPGLSPRAIERLRVGADLMNEMTDRLRRMRETAAEVGRVFGSAFDRVFRDLFQDFDNFGERLKAIFRDIAADLVSILLSPLRQHIQNLVAGLAFGSGIFVGPGAPSIGGSTPADFRSVFGSNRLFGGATTFGSTAGAAAGGIIAPRINVNATFNSLSAEGNRQLLGSLNRTVGNAVNSALTQRSSGQRRAAASFRGL